MPHDIARPAATGTFAASADDLAAAARGPVLSRLDELGTIRVDGADALRFLQSQLTNDVERLSGDLFQLTGYCTAKGRMLATFHQWIDGDSVILQLPHEILAATQRRLGMFVLRSKVKLVDHTPQLATYALIGGGSVDLLRESGLPIPEAPGASHRLERIRVSRLRPGPRSRERFLLSVDQDAGLPAALTAVTEVASDVWWWSEIDAAVPTVFAATQEKFVPQMINFEVLGGVDFRKGCYPGQEIVARSQYLGKLRRRMRPAHVVGEEPPTVGSDVVRSADGQPVGTVVMSARALGGGCDLLVEAPVDKLDNDALHVAETAQALHVRALPYELFDPTE